MQNVKIELQYFPSIYWYALLHQAGCFLIDDTEYFRKQTYRSRMVILTANKPLPLIVPVKKGRSTTTVKEVKIENAFNWQHVHFAALNSAYKSSPYYDHYIHHFQSFLTRRNDNLFDFNFAIVMKTLQILQWESEKIALFSKSNSEKGAEPEDWCGRIRPKKNTNGLPQGIKDVPYRQVFSDRFDFVPGLSILDLLFNMGPESGEVLKKMTTED